MSGNKSIQQDDNASELACQQQSDQTDDTFVWDANTRLYYHSNTGFYHDPEAGWYYSSKDGLYYKFENGNYVLLHSHQGDESHRSHCDSTAPNNAIQHHTYANTQEFSSSDHTRVVYNEMPENPPPSEWLEDTLIDLYLSNYPNQSMHATPDTAMHVESNELDESNVSAADAGNDDTYELEEGEWIPDDHLVSSCSNEGTSLEEEHWQAQYGQVTRSDDDSLSGIQVINLWDWSLVNGSWKERKHKVTRLVGRLVKRSAKLHPSMPSTGGLLRTAPICGVHLDLVRVKSGKIYRLRNPSPRFLASLSNYDSSNPTKDWGFPQLLMDRLVRADTASGSEIRGLVGQKDSSLSSEQNRGHVYRDRAAERRALHNGIGVGPGQKKAFDSPDSDPSSSMGVARVEVMGESVKASFGAGSYARRILENMGWKEGESLGSSNKGLIEPLEATRNVGNAGLGWNQSRGKHPK